MEEDFGADTGQLLEAHIEPRADDPNIPNVNDFRDLSDFEQARNLRRSGEYSDAIRAFESIIVRDPNGFWAPRALKQILQCYVSGRMELPRFREVLGQIVNNERQQNTDFSNMARRLEIKCLAAEGRIEDAIRLAFAYSQNEDNEVLSSVFEFDALYLESYLNEDDLDAVITRDQRMGQLEARIMELE